MIYTVTCNMKFTACIHSGYHTYIPAGWLISACGELGCLSALGMCPDVARDGPYDAVNSWN